jgi:hypothetical protein
MKIALVFFQWQQRHSNKVEELFQLRYNVFATLFYVSYTIYMPSTYNIHNQNINHYRMPKPPSPG